MSFDDKHAENIYKNRRKDDALITATECACIMARTVLHITPLHTMYSFSVKLKYSFASTNNALSAAEAT